MSSDKRRGSYLGSCHVLELLKREARGKEILISLVGIKNALRNYS